MYKATVTKNLSELKRLQFGVIMFWNILVVVALTLIGEKIDNEAMGYSFLLFMVFAVSWMLNGTLHFNARKGELRIESDQLKFKWMKEEEVVVDLKDVSPKYMVKAFYPIGFLWKIDYIHLFLDGGPLGPREFFFVHDGEYNASQWEKLSIEPILDPNSSLQLIQ